MAEFAPPDFDVPLGLETSELVLEPLGPGHNERDYDAWTSSMEHIAATPGYPDGSWPREMTSDENCADLQSPRPRFPQPEGFTYTVLDPGSRSQEDTQPTGLWRPAICADWFRSRRRMDTNQRETAADVALPFIW